MGSDLYRAVFARSPLVLHREASESGDQIQMVHTGDGQIFELDGLLARLFCALDSTSTLGQLIADLDPECLKTSGSAKLFEKAWLELLHFKLIERV